MRHKEILTEAQTGLLPTIKEFSTDFGLVGGTAIALHIGHRESIDFDLFSKDPSAEFKTAKLKNKFARGALLERVFVEEGPELTFVTKTGVKVTFYHFEYPLPYTERFGRVIDMPTLLTLAAMKAFAIGQRNKWKDYVDLYFIMRDFHSLDDIIHQAEKLFGSEFNAKLFRQQLSFFDDISYKEEVTFKSGFAVPEAEIKRALTEYSLA